jgi:hypothetical protein
MRKLLLLCAVTAAVGCASEPAAVRVAEHQMSAEPETPGSSGSAGSTTTATTVAPTTTSAPTTTVDVTTTTEAPAPATTAAPRRTTTTLYEPPSPQGRTTGTGDEPPAGDMPAVMERIAGCESGSGPYSPGSYTAQNPRSSASGRYQFIDSTWQSLDAAGDYERAVHAPPAVQDAAALELYRRSGTAPWNESKGCWA